MAEIQSLARGLTILDILSQSQGGASITEVAEILGVDKGSASRLMSTLAMHGYSEKNPVTRRYTLGPQIIRLSGSLLTRMPLHESARPFLQKLMQRTGECAHLAILAQDKALYIDQMNHRLHCASMPKWEDGPLALYCAGENPAGFQQW